MSMREQVLSLLDAMIKAQPGSKGNGCDEVAQRNGIVLAYNAVFDMEWPAPSAEPVATAWMKDGVMVNAFARPPCTAEEWAKHDHKGYWSSKGYSEAPLYAAPQPDSVAELEAECERLKKLSVTNILIDMELSAPNANDVFDKVFAESCEDIYAVFNRLDDKAEKLERERDEARAECERLRSLLEEARDDVASELDSMRQRYGTGYKQQRIANQADLLARIDAALAAKGE